MEKKCRNCKHYGSEYGFIPAEWFCDKHLIMTFPDESCEEFEPKESKKFVCLSCGHVYVDEPLDKSELRKQIENFVQEDPFLQKLDVDKNKIVDICLRIAEEAYSLNRELIEWEKKTFGVILCPICNSPLNQLSKRGYKNLQKKGVEFEV